MKRIRVALVASFLLTAGLALVIVWAGQPATCYAGQPTPCHDTEHPGEPPCNMASCKRMAGGGNTCSHYCTKGANCCFCKKDQCDTHRGGGTPDDQGSEPQAAERPQ